jgi:tRNA U38,U39,U40 pseudouridine synthase TruA
VKKQKNTKQEIMYALTHPEKQYDFGVASPEQLILNDIIYPFSFQIDENGLRKKEELKEKIISDF